MTVPIVEEENCECEQGECECDYEQPESESESEDEYESVYFKYCFEGCETIDDILCTLNRLKQQFEQYKKDGHKLTQPVDTGYCFIDKKVEYPRLI